MSGYSDAPQDLLALLRVQLRVIGALTVREINSRFGKEGLGFLWLFGEPTILGLAVGGIYTLTHSTMPGGISPAFFVITSYIMFYALRGIINRAPGLIYGSQSLLYHRCITVLDIIIAKNMLEGAAAMVVMLVFLGVWWLITGQWVVHIEYVVLAVALVSLFAHGIATIIAAGSIHTEMFERLTHLFTYITIPFTGFMFMVFWLPYDVQRLVLWIPTVHMFEMMRYGVFGDTLPIEFDMAYVVGWCLVVNVLGLLLLRQARRSLVI